jgi:4-oxalomesaconate tautomerase
VVCLAAADFGLTGQESPAELEGNAELTKRVEAIRLAAGPMMNLGDVADNTVPKMSLVSPPAVRERGGLGGASPRDNTRGVVSTRTFIPHRVHEAIGVLGAVSVATACVLPGSVANAVAVLPDQADGGTEIGGTEIGGTEIEVEHPTGFFTVTIDVQTSGGAFAVTRSALLRTARLLMRGEVLVPASVWDGQGGPR